MLPRSHQTGITVASINYNQVEVLERKFAYLTNVVVLSLLEVYTRAFYFSAQVGAPLRVVINSVNFASMALVPKRRHAAAPLKDCRRWWQPLLDLSERAASNPGLPQADAKCFSKKC